MQPAAMEVSMPSIKAGSTTASATTHGFTPGSIFSAEVSCSSAIVRSAQAATAERTPIGYNTPGASFGDMRRIGLSRSGGGLFPSLRSESCNGLIPIDLGRAVWTSAFMPAFVSSGRNLEIGQPAVGS